MIKIVKADDWMGVYIDEKLVYEGHSIAEDKLIKLCNIEHELIWCDDEWLCDRGNLPKEFKDVKI